MHLVLAALRLLGAFVLGVILAVSAVRALGVAGAEPAAMLVLIVVYAAIGGSILALAPPRFGAFLLLGWVAPWLLVGLVAIDDSTVLVFPASITALYVLALCLAAYRAARRRDDKVPRGREQR